MLAYLDREDAEAARRSRGRYSCSDHAPEDSQAEPLRLQRAIGVIYRRDTERQSHYLHARLAQQFDAMIHIDETSALEPLDKEAVWSAGEAPETFPSGI